MGVACLLERRKDGLLIGSELRMRPQQHEELRAAQNTALQRQLPIAALYRRNTRMHVLISVTAIGAT